MKQLKIRYSQRRFCRMMLSRKRLSRTRRAGKRAGRNWLSKARGAKNLSKHRNRTTVLSKRRAPTTRLSAMYDEPFRTIYNTSGPTRNDSKKVLPWFSMRSVGREEVLPARNVAWKVTSHQKARRAWRKFWRSRFADNRSPATAHYCQQCGDVAHPFEKCDPMDDLYD